MRAPPRALAIRRSWSTPLVESWQGVTIGARRWSRARERRAKFGSRNWGNPVHRRARARARNERRRVKVGDFLALARARRHTSRPDFFAPLVAILTRASACTRQFADDRSFSWCAAAAATEALKWLHADSGDAAATTTTAAAAATTTTTTGDDHAACAAAQKRRHIQAAVNRRPLRVARSHKAHEQLDNRAAPISTSVASRRPPLFVGADERRRRRRQSRNRAGDERAASGRRSSEGAKAAAAMAAATARPCSRAHRRLSDPTGGTLVWPPAAAREATTLTRARRVAARSHASARRTATVSTRHSPLVDCPPTSSRLCARECQKLGAPLPPISSSRASAFCRVARRV